MIDVYTSYISNIKSIDDDMLIVLVCRYIPKSLRIDNKKIIHSVKLSPSPTLIKVFKEGMINYDEFIRRYLIELDSRNLNLNNVNTNKMCFVCYEKDKHTCHRVALAKYLESNGQFIYKGEI